jgi:short-subunit dehydrogenase
MNASTRPLAVVTGASSGIGQAVYNASKSFVQSFALALRNELKDTGVTITSLMPGPTETELFERADMLDSRRVDQHQAAGSPGRLLPDSAKAAMHRSMAEPGSAKE